jgi:hypothetical protein
MRSHFDVVTGLLQFCDQTATRRRICWNKRPTSASILILQKAWWLRCVIAIVCLMPNSLCHTNPQTKNESYETEKRQ